MKRFEFPARETSNQLHRDPKVNRPTEERALRPQPTRSWVSSALVATALLSGGIAACRGRTTSETGPIRIATILPATGDLASDVANWLRGANMAVQEVNAAGGPIEGRLVELIAFDSSSEPRPDITMDAIMRGVVGIIGDAGSGGTLEIYAAAQRNQIPVGSCCATSPTLTAVNESLRLEDRHFFRAIPSDLEQAKVLARITSGMTAGQSHVCSDVSIYFRDDDYGRPFAVETQVRIGATATLIPFQPDRTRTYHDTQITTLHDGTPDCVVLIAYPDEAALVLSAYYRVAGAMENTVWIGTDGIRGRSFVTNTDAAAALRDPRCSFFGAAPYSQGTSAEFSDFSRDHQTLYGFAPEAFVSSTYDVTAMMLLGIARAQSTEGPAIMAAIRQLDSDTAPSAGPGELAGAIRALRGGSLVNYQGASGSMDVDDLGNVTGDYEVWRVDVAGAVPDFRQLSVITAAELR